MVIAWAGNSPLDYAPCRYGASRLTFRGPQRALDRPYVAVVGGTESYGKYIAQPWPALTESAIGVPVVNLACVNASADAYLADHGALQVARGARVVVVQVMGAANLSNPFYAVHPRRNDRFLRALPPLLRLYPEVDFTAIHFTRHLLLSLQRDSAERFQQVAAALKGTWAAQMHALVQQVSAPVVLVWLATRMPGTKGAQIGPEPVLVDADMVAGLRAVAEDYVELVLAPSADPVADGMAVTDYERPAALGLPGQQAHVTAAATIGQALARFV